MMKKKKLTLLFLSLAILAVFIGATLYTAAATGLVANECSTSVDPYLQPNLPAAEYPEPPVIDCQFIPVVQK
jgi:hypothetical protein